MLDFLQLLEIDINVCFYSTLHGLITPFPIPSIIPDRQYSCHVSVSLALCQSSWTGHHANLFPGKSRQATGAAAQCQIQNIPGASRKLVWWWGEPQITEAKLQHQFRRTAMAEIKPQTTWSFMIVDVAFLLIFVLSQWTICSEYSIIITRTKAMHIVIFDIIARNYNLNTSGLKKWGELQKI